MVANSSTQAQVSQRNGTTNHQTRQNWLISTPRTASNLLVKVLNLNEQPSLVADAKKDYYLLSVPMMKYENKMLGKTTDQWTDDQRKKLRDLYKQSIDSLQSHIREAASNGKDVFVKEHAVHLIEPTAESRWITKSKDAGNDKPWIVDTGHGSTRTPGNLTLFSDEFLRTWQPTILIRHPALVFPSLYRASLDMSASNALEWDVAHGAEMTWHWSRSLYDWYRKQYETDKAFAASVPGGAAQWPIVLDADDFITSPAVVAKYCEAVNLDPTKLLFEWEVATKEHLEKFGAIGKRMLSTISASTGVIKGKTSQGLVMAEEVTKWKQEFGDEQGANMERWVMDAMPDYEYLKARRFR